MMLMCGQSNRIWSYWAGRHPGSVGVLISPSYMKKVPIDFYMPFGLDNDAYTCFKKNKPWDVEAWRNMISYIRLFQIKPLWAIVPDVVANREATMKNWNIYRGEIANAGWPAAFCVQDGMGISDVPIDADVIFVGGTDAWKFPNLKMWTDNFSHVHCGRVNSIRMIERCEQLGCKSVDGTGWFRAPDRPDHLPALKLFIEGYRRRDHETWLF